MTRNWYELFKSWAKPPSDTEEAKGANAARMINDALRMCESLKNRNFEVYASGSYRNNTNIRLGSDIDIAVVLTDSFYGEYPPSGVPSRELLGFSDASYGFSDFREDVSKALVAKFGSKGVTAGDKTFNVHENSYRLDADVSTFLEHRRYTGNKNPDGSWHYYRGVEMRPRNDSGKRIINWHQQHYDEGVAKNTKTNRRFKRVTRILKRMREDMIECATSDAKSAAGSASSFLLECLVFNAPDNCFNLEEGSYYEDTKSVIRKLWNLTKAEDVSRDLVEVNRLKPLFHNTQPWSRVQAHEFLLRGWQHIGFK